METRTFTDTDGIFIFLLFGSLLLRVLINDVIVNHRNKTRFWIFAMWGFDQSVWDHTFQVMFTPWWKSKAPDKILKILSNAFTILMVIGVVGLFGRLALLD